MGQLDTEVSYDDLLPDALELFQRCDRGPIAANDANRMNSLRFSTALF